MLKKSSAYIATDAGFAVGVVLNVVPFPYRYGYYVLFKGLPILLQSSFTKADRQRLNLSEVEKLDDYLVTSCMTGNLAIAVGCVGTLEDG